MIDSFPEGQFLIEDYHAHFRFDCNKYRSGIVLYVREDALAKVLCHNFSYAERFLSKLICTKGSGFLAVHIIHTKIANH